MTDSDRRRIARILQAAAKIAVVVAEGRETFDHDERARDHAWMQAALIGDRVHRMSSEFRLAHAGLFRRLGDLRELRNAVVHHYDELDHDEDWRTLSVTLPDLVEQLRGIEFR